MKMIKLKNLIFVSILAWLGSESIFAQNSELNFFTDFNLALEKAEAENKEVFVYVGRGKSASEKKLDSLFHDGEVVSFLNERYISVRLDDLPDVRFIKYYNIRQYPILMFFDSSGDKLYEIPYCCSNYSKDVFFDEALFASTRPLPRKEHLEKNFKKRKNDPELLKELLVLAKRFEDKKLVENVLEQYAKIYHLDAENEWMSFVLEHVSEESSMLFEILVEHKEDLENKYGVLEVQSEILRIMLENVKVRFDLVTTDDLIDQLIKKINNHKLDIDINYLMLAVAKRKYSKVRSYYKVKKDRGEFAFQMLKSHNQHVDKTTMASLICDIANHSDNRLYLKTAFNQLENFMIDIETEDLADCRSELMDKLGMVDQ